MCAMHASKNLEHLSKALSQLHSIQTFTLQCEQRHVDRTISYPLAELFQTILQLPFLKFCTLHLWNLAEKNFDYEGIAGLPSNHSIECLDVAQIDRIIFFTLLTRCQGLKSLTAKRCAAEDFFVLQNLLDVMSPEFSCPNLSMITLSICNLRFKELESICAYAADPIRHLRLDYSVYIYTNHYEDYLDYFDQSRWKKLLKNINAIVISIEIHPFDDVAKDIVSNLAKLDSCCTWNVEQKQSPFAHLSIKN